MATITLNLIGGRFGRLTVVEELPPVIQNHGPKNPNHKTRRYRCVCDCGTSIIARQGNLRNNHTTSCGCFKVEACRASGKIAHPRHGQARRRGSTPEYRAWRNMISRCNNPRATGYRLYGGRGISVCSRWMECFENFFADMGLRPSSDHSLDRYPNQNGNYEPNNCRWANDTQQQRNRRTNRLMEYEGEMICVTEACQRAGINANTVRVRLHQGQTIEQAFTPPRR